MAILHRKEEKIQVVLGRLPKKYTQEEFVEMFIKLYSKDWGKIKSAYIKQSQDKEPGTVVNMPKPDLYLKQVLETYLTTKATEVPAEETKVTPAVTEEPVVKAKKAVSKKKTEETPAEEKAIATKAKAAPKKKAETEVAPVKEVKAKAVAKKKAETEVAPVKEVKAKAVPKKKVADEKAPAKAKKAKTTES
ncbi:hypothetical protein D3C87_212310 [compost metagenome]